MPPQTWSHIIIAVGIFLTAAGGLGSYIFGKIEAQKKERDSRQSENGPKQEDWYSTGQAIHNPVGYIFVAFNRSENRPNVV